MRRFPDRSKIAELRYQRAMFVEKVFRLVAAHPPLDNLQMLGIGFDIQHRYLVRSPKALYLVSVDFLWSGPPFWRAKNDHGPAWATYLRVAGRCRASVWIDRISSTHSSTVAAIF